MTTRLSGGAQTFGTRLRALRVAAGLTQEELAERAGLTPHGVSSLERGRRTRPYPHTVRALARALELDDEAAAALFATLPGRTATQQDVASATADASTHTGAEETQRRGLRLSVPSTPLYGRDEETAALVGLIRGGARLITVAGPGGVGKTRLAGAVAERLALDFVDGAVQVDLAHTTDVRHLLVGICDVLGLPGADTVQDVEPLISHLADQRLLLVLDNLEQVPGAGEPAAELVRRCPGLVVVATSRVALRIRDETVVLLGPLPVPEPSPSTLEDLEAAPAGAMFLERARSAAHDLSLLDTDAAAIAEICRRLAGIPLALELTAGQLAVLGPDQLLTRLSEALRQPGATDLPDRQRTLHATLEWSRTLLTSDEQRLLSRLAVFRGGFAIDAAEAVDEPGQQTWSTLRRLVEQSLVQVGRSSDGSTRYRMLEPVAEYAASLLDPGRLAQARHAHAAYVLALAEEAAPHYTGDQQLRWLARLDREDANVAAAMQWVLGEGRDPASAGRLGYALWLYWWLRGRARTGRELLEQVLGHELPHAVAANAWLGHAAMTFAQGDLAASTRSWQEALRLATVVGDETVSATAEAGSGIVAMACGELQSARTALEGALRRFRTQADWRARWMTGLCEIWLGTVLHYCGERAAAAEHLRSGLAAARARGDRLSTYIALFNLAQVAVADADLAGARTALHEAARLSTETRDVANLAYVLEALASLAATQDDLERVPLLVGAAEALRESVEGAVFGYYVPDAAQLATAVERARLELEADTYDDILDRGRGLDFASAAEVVLGS